MIGYLRGSLDIDRGGQIALVYDRLYASLAAAVLLASARLDADGMRAAAALIGPVRDAWAAAISADEGLDVPAPGEASDDFAG